MKFDPSEVSPIFSIEPSLIRVVLAYDDGTPVLVLRGDSAQPTMAEGGAADSPVLDGCNRSTAGGPL